MPVGLDFPSSIQAIAGIRIGAADSGLRKSEGEDLAIFEISDQASIAGAFTTNRALAAPVQIAIDHLRVCGSSGPGERRALVVNSGNANAGVGAQGLEDCLAVCDMVADEMDIPRHAVLPFSTGVIGERLALEKFLEHVPLCVGNLKKNNWIAASKAIMTTDIVPKAISKTLDLGDGRQIRISGIAKGSGMIEPNMATMLAFIATDALVPPEYLQSILTDVVDHSFNCITVDGDTSTNDSSILIATGQSAIEISERAAQSIQDEFARAILEVATYLAQSIVRDGEGATKFITINVSDGKNKSDCARVAKTVANSLLVKTAMHASDPNWGRIYAAVGRAGLDDLDLARVSILINETEVMSNGAVSPRYCEQEAFDQMREDEFSINIRLGLDTGHSATVWTTDLSYEYVRINAEYRT